MTASGTKANGAPAKPPPHPAPPPLMTDTSSADSTLFSIAEQELLDCPDTQEHKAVCLVGATRRLHQLGFQLPESLRSRRQQVSCKAMMLQAENDVLHVLKCLLDDYERLRDERDALRSTEKLQRHELGRLSRRSGSLERQLVLADKKLADSEYRLDEQRQAVERLGAEAKREAQKARLAQSGLRRLEDESRHRQRRTERELFEARQRLEKTDRRLLLPAVAPPLKVTINGGGGGGRRQRLSSRQQPPRSTQRRTDHSNSGDGGGGGGNPADLTARHAIVMESELFDTVEMPPLTRARLAGGGVRRNRSLPTQPYKQQQQQQQQQQKPQVQQPCWYKVPLSGEVASIANSSSSWDGAGSRHGGEDDLVDSFSGKVNLGGGGGGGGLGESSVISLAETIDASGCCCRATGSSTSSSPGRRSAGRFSTGSDGSRCSGGGVRGK